MEVSGKRINLPSEPCEICLTHGADGFCTECIEYMCKECFDHHAKGKPCRYHTLCSLDQGPIQIVTQPFEKKCDIHRNENLKYYCIKHEVVGCGDCMISNHDGCKPKLISHLATNFEESDEFKELLRMIEQYDTESKENLQSVQNNLKENKNMFDKALSEVRQFRKLINDYLDQAEKNVITEANTYSKGNESLLSELQAKIAAVSMEVDDIRKKLDTNKHQGVDLFIGMVECKPRVSKVEQTVAENKLCYTFQAYIFEPEQKLRDLLISNVKLGYIALPNCIGNKQRDFSETLHRERAETVSEVKYPRARNYSPPDRKDAPFDSYEAKTASKEEYSRKRENSPPYRKDESFDSYEAKTASKEEYSRMRDKSQQYRNDASFDSYEAKTASKEEYSRKRDKSPPYRMREKIQQYKKDASFDRNEAKTASKEEYSRTRDELPQDRKEASFDRNEAKTASKEKYSRTKNNIPPDPRSAGFDIGRRVRNIFGNSTGTVTKVVSAGYVTVSWDNGSVSPSFPAIKLRLI